MFVWVLEKYAGSSADITEPIVTRTVSRFMLGLI